jgi:hypothetical protein
MMILRSRIASSHATPRQRTKPHTNNATYLITDTDGDGLGTLNRLRFSFSRHDVAVLFLWM